MKSVFILFAVGLFSVFTSLQAQSNFNIESYKSFLNSNQNMSSEQFFNMHPAGSFRGNINSDYTSAQYFDSIAIKYELTDYEKSLLSANGFFVSERLSKDSFGEALKDIYHKDLPVFITTDAILHAFHVSYDRMLMETEVNVIITKLEAMLSQLRSSLLQLDSKYSSDILMQKSLKDIDIYLTVAQKLLGQGFTPPYYPKNATKANDFFNKAKDGEGFAYDTLFADACVAIDWSQFKPRGHYVSEKYPILEKYFRTMIWLGRTEIYLLPPKALNDPECLAQDFEDAVRQTVDAYLLLELFDISNSWQEYNDIEQILRFFVGESDNITLENLAYLKDALQISNANELLDSLKMIEFQDSLKNQSFAYQKILSQILISGDPFSPDSIVPAASFLLFGQRFVIDSYVTASVVYDRIKYNNEKICRLFPSALDPMFVLGNNAAGQLLKPEIDEYHYSSNLAALRYLVDSYDQEFWNSTIYNSWLNALRKLNPPEVKSALPSFMQTGAYWQEKLNTQLASWSQLRHDNLLYAKQSYSGGSVCSYPFSYVEPFPEFYSSLKDYAVLAQTKFQDLPFDNDNIKDYMIRYFNRFESVMDTLSVVSQKIIDGTAFNENEEAFLRSILYDNPSTVCGDAPLEGWYPKLFYSDEGNEELLKADHIVADIHTTPTDCGGTFMGWVSHVGTGPVNLGVFIADLPGGGPTAFVGPVLSYYEYRTENFLRLTDQEWDNQYLQSALRPSWVNAYLADSSGSSRGEGLNLITSVNSGNTNVLPSDYLTAANYPNPFNPSTVISFNVPYDVSNSHVQLIIYNIQGEEIIKLVDEDLPAGNYVTRWDGRNSSGIQVTSGIYIYNLKAADKQFSGKMTLLK